MQQVVAGDRLARPAPRSLPPPGQGMARRPGTRAAKAVCQRRGAIPGVMQHVNLRPSCSIFAKTKLCLSKHTNKKNAAYKR